MKIKTALKKNIIIKKILSQRTQMRIKRQMPDEKEIIKKIKKKENDCITYIIRRPTMNSGFFSDFFYVLGHCIYADKKGYIPVVDMENYKTLYSEKKMFRGTKNAWEYYFEQPANVSLKEAYNNSHIILSQGKYKYEYVPYYKGIDKCFPNKDIVNELQQYIASYIHIKPEYVKKANDFYDKYKGKNVLGVHIRGNDMFHVEGHPVPASVDTFIDKITNVVHENNIDNIIICTDEKRIVKCVKDKLGDIVQETDAYRAAEHETTGIHSSRTKVKRENHKYKLGAEVLEDALILSKCDYLMCGHSNVPYASIVLNNNQYKNIYVVEKNK